MVCWVGQHHDAQNETGGGVVCKWDSGGEVGAEWRQARIPLPHVQTNNQLTCVTATRFLVCGGGGGVRGKGGGETRGVGSRDTTVSQGGLPSALQLCEWCFK